MGARVLDVGGGRARAVNLQRPGHPGCLGVCCYVEVRCCMFGSLARKDRAPQRRTVPVEHAVYFGVRGAGVFRLRCGELARLCEVDWLF